MRGARGFADASAPVQVIEVPQAVRRSQGDVDPFGTPHYWLDPANGAPIGMVRSFFTNCGTSE